jgi:hypothetical protein
MGYLPQKKQAQGSPAPSKIKKPQRQETAVSDLSIHLVLDRFACVFHVFAKSFGGFATGKGGHAQGHQKQANDCFHQCFHFSFRVLGELHLVWSGYIRPINARMMMMINSTPTNPPGP